jgi:3-deoxy-D-manno-octulosonic-acid transferase
MILYRLGVYFYYLFIKFASLFNEKAKLWIEGRKSQEHVYQNELEKSARVWFHFASVGEFEQGRSIIEYFKKNFPNYKIVISFFSPSGYELRKNYPVEKVYYLPLDTPSNAKAFINHIQPSIAIFNKYEYWHYMMEELHKREIPLFVTSAIFRKNQLFFKWYGWFNRKTLGYVSHFFTQNIDSDQLLVSIDHENFTMAGDTRFDRVYEHAQNVKDDERILKFAANQKVFVAGSTWPEDEKLIIDFIKNRGDLKFIIVPHEIKSENIQKLYSSLKPHAVLYSKFDEDYNTDKKILIVDNIGLLSGIYHIAHICYIGGGFGKGIHNTLEAATFGKPIIFGPNYTKFQEAKDLIARTAAFSINNSEELNKIGLKLLNDEEYYKQAASSSREYVLEKKGATEVITNYLKQLQYIQ